MERVISQSSRRLLRSRSVNVGKRNAIGGLRFSLTSAKVSCWPNPYLTPSWVTDLVPDQERSLRSEREEKATTSGSWALLVVRFPLLFPTTYYYLTAIRSVGTPPPFPNSPNPPTITGFSSLCGLFPSGILTSTPPPQIASLPRRLTVVLDTPHPSFRSTIHSTSKLVIVVRSLYQFYAAPLHLPEAQEILEFGRTDIPSRPEPCVVSSMKLMPGMMTWG